MKSEVTNHEIKVRYIVEKDGKYVKNFHNDKDGIYEVSYTKKSMAKEFESEDIAMKVARELDSNLIKVTRTYITLKNEEEVSFIV